MERSGNVPKYQAGKYWEHICDFPCLGGKSMRSLSVWPAATSTRAWSKNFKWRASFQRLELAAIARPAGVDVANTELGNERNSESSESGIEEEGLPDLALMVTLVAPSHLNALGRLAAGLALHLDGRFQPPRYVHIRQGLWIQGPEPIHDLALQGLSHVDVPGIHGHHVPDVLLPPQAVHLGVPGVDTSNPGGLHAVCVPVARSVGMEGALLRTFPPALFKMDDPGPIHGPDLPEVAVVGEHVEAPDRLPALPDP